MKCPHPMLAIAVLAICGLYCWGATGANENDKPVPTTAATEVPDARNVIDRIEALEKRLAELEKREAPIRQADNRDEQNLDLPKNTWQSRPAPMLRVEDHDDSQNTNGQKWSFRLLSHQR